MSTRFTIYCETCEVPGPHIRRHHLGALLMEEHSARFFPTSDDDQASRDWGGFLIEHEYHDLRLKYEWRPPKPSKPPRPFTHRLLPDGTLEEIT